MIIGKKLNMEVDPHKEKGQEHSKIKEKYVFDDLELADMMLQF